MTHHNDTAKVVHRALALKVQPRTLSRSSKRRIPAPQWDYHEGSSHWRYSSATRLTALSPFEPLSPRILLCHGAAPSSKGQEGSLPQPGKKTPQGEWNFTDGKFIPEVTSPEDPLAYAFQIRIIKVFHDQNGVRYYMQIPRRIKVQHHHYLHVIIFQKFVPALVHSVFRRSMGVLQGESPVFFILYFQINLHDGNNGTSVDNRGNKIEKNIAVIVMSYRNADCA